ncbi:MAG: hypothetical protein PHN88_14685 [Ignavibacteria bacterium]|nr:hypothetical protein [Ignavibacteria bacterium]
MEKTKPIISTGEYTRKERQIDNAPFKAMDEIIHKFILLQKRVERTYKMTNKTLGKE